MDTSINELLKDFRSALSKVDFQNYNPTSSEFMTALFIGSMWKLLCELEEDNSKIISTMNLENNDDISGEIMGTKKYLQKYLDTSDDVYKEMATDEMKHANILIKKMYAKLPNTEMKEKLKTYENQLKQLSEQIINS